MFKRLFIIIYLLIISFSLFSTPNTSSYDLRLYQSYKSGDMTIWVKVMEDLNRDYKSKPSNKLLINITQAQYGYIGYLIGIKDNKSARDLLEQAEANVERILKSQPNNADALALKAAFLAYHISLSPYKAPFIGPKSMTLIDQAIAINPESVQAIIEKANSLHYAPSMFGGNPTEALIFYKKAIKIFEEKNQGNPPENWVYLNMLAQLALSYQKANQPDNAQKTFKRILNIAPDFKWVKDELYPKFLISNQ